MMDELTEKRLAAPLWDFLRQVKMGVRVDNALRHHFGKEATVANLVALMPDEVSWIAGIGPTSLLIIKGALSLNDLTNENLFVAWDGRAAIAKSKEKP